MVITELVISFLKAWVFLQCILVSEEDEEATFVEASKRGRCLLSSTVVQDFIVYLYIRCKIFL